MAQFAEQVVEVGLFHDLIGLLIISPPGRTTRLIPIISMGVALNARQSFDGGQGDLVGAKAEDAPAARVHLEVIPQVGVDSGSAVVATVGPDAALDLDEAAALQVGKIGPPAAFVVEAKFPS